VLAHLAARHAPKDVLDAVPLLGGLSAERAALIRAGDVARMDRNRLSADIGRLLKRAGGGSGDSGGRGDSEAAAADAVAALKTQVEAATNAAGAADAALAAVDAQVAVLFAQLPNLLADDVPPGRDDRDNVIVAEWGTERRKMAAEGGEGEGFAWHDDLAAGLNGYLTEAAAGLSGARFSVLAGQVSEALCVQHCNTARARVRSLCVSLTLGLMLLLNSGGAAGAGSRVLFPGHAHTVQRLHGDGRAVHRRALHA